ncbi:MAG: aminotransferase class V-fold PLP-dependent enzyme, partial [Myxococcota bacterium]
MNGLSSGRHFASDNASGVHPRILEAMAAANEGHAMAYGADPWSSRAREAFCREFGDDIEVLWCFGGTGANVMALASVLRFHDSIVCSDVAHILDSETGAPERVLGAKLTGAPSRYGKIDADALAPLLADPGHSHATRPRVLSLTQATEWGTVYSTDELTRLTELAHEHGVLVHLDGARIANAAAALKIGFRAATRDLGVDIVSFGGTKNGLMMAESVVFFDPSVAPAASAVLKQVTQLPSKARFIAAQYEAYFAGELWRQCAEHANERAQQLARGLLEIDG